MLEGDLVKQRARERHMEIATLLAYFWKYFLLIINTKIETIKIVVVKHIQESINHIQEIKQATNFFL